MGHNPNIILLGTTQSNVKEVTCEKGDPSVFKAGIAVRRAPSGNIQLIDDGTAVLIGISLGEDLSGAGGNTGYTAVCRTGNYIPLVLQNDAASVKIADITFNSKVFGAAGNNLSITIADNQTGNVAVVTVANNKDVTVAIDAGVTTTTTLRNAIAAHPEAKNLIDAVIDSGDEAAVIAAAAAKTSLTGGSDVAVPGKPVLVDDATGQGSADGDITAAMYISGVLTGLYADGTTVPAAWVSMPGGF